MSDEICWKKTHCARMDHGGCALIVGVKNNKIVKIKGDPKGYLNQGYVCPKGLLSADRLNHPKRLKHPLKRAGARGQGRWEPVSWSEALDIIAINLNKVKEKYGAKGVAFCQGMPKGLEHFVLIRLANIFGSPNFVAVQDVCHAPREVTGIHTCGFYPVVDFHHKSKTILLWGSNSISTNEEGEISSLLLKQLKQGTDLIVIDPRKTALAQKAKFWIPVKPGTDAALALAFLNVIIEEKLYDKDFVLQYTYGFDELAEHVKNYPPEKAANITGVDADLIKESAIHYAKSKPAALAWGNPIEQNKYTFDTTRALVCLMAVCGNLDVSGGNIQPEDPNIMGLGQFVRADLIPDKRKTMIHAHHHTIPRLMTVPPSFFKKAVLEQIPYPVKAAYIQCSNPLITYANSPQTYDALMNLDFFAVADIFMTPTAHLADIVLPSATHFEFNDIGHYGIGHGYILARPKVVEPPHECWPDMKILNELGKKLTDNKYWFDNHEEFLNLVLKPSNMTFSEFTEIGYLKGRDQFEKYKDSGFKTPTGKVELRLTRAEKFNLPPLPSYSGALEANKDYPLILTSAKDPYFLHSSYRWMEKLRKHSPKPKAQIHPDTAKKYGIIDGQMIKIETISGSITQFASITSKISPDVVCAAYGWWIPEKNESRHYEWDKFNFNMLTSTNNLGKEFGTPNLKGICCKISPAN